MITAPQPAVMIGNSWVVVALCLGAGMAYLRAVAGIGHQPGQQRVFDLNETGRRQYKQDADSM